MVTKKFLLVAVLIGFLASGCSQGMMAAKPDAGSPPVITGYFARSQGAYGDPIRIYLAAEDADGDMLRIAVQVTQVGFGSYFTDWTYLKPQYQKKFVGYLQWNTWGGHTSYLPEWTRITVKISVLDKSGKESNAVILPYEFVSGAPPGPALPAPFDQANVPRLGYIDVNFFNPADMGNDIFLD